MAEQLTENEDFYYNEQGDFVFTEKYHLEKGYCCGNGCKHCPYNFDSVPEPRRSELLSLRQHEKK
ncbi:MAG: DUF5522 domain-containing protein [Ferruginibacter sp.]